MTDYFTIKQVEKKMNLKRNAIMKLIKDGKLGAYRTGGDTGSYRITQKQIDRCIQGTNNPESERGENDEK